MVIALHASDQWTSKNSVDVAGPGFFTGYSSHPVAHKRRLTILATNGRKAGESSFMEVKWSQVKSRKCFKKEGMIMLDPDVSSVMSWEMTFLALVMLKPWWGIFTGVSEISKKSSWNWFKRKREEEKRRWVFYGICCKGTQRDKATAGGGQWGIEKVLFYFYFF